MCLGLFQWEGYNCFVISLELHLIGTFSLWEWYENVSATHNLIRPISFSIPTNTDAGQTLIIFLNCGEIYITKSLPF